MLIRIFYLNNIWIALSRSWSHSFPAQSPITHKQCHLRTARNAPPQKIQKWHHALHFPRSVQQPSKPPRSFSTPCSFQMQARKLRVPVQFENKDHGLHFSAWKWKLGFTLSWKGNFLSFPASCQNTKLIAFFLFKCWYCYLSLFLSLDTWTDETFSHLGIMSDSSWIHFHVGI